MNRTITIILIVSLFINVLSLKAFANEDTVIIRAEEYNEILYDIYQKETKEILNATGSFFENKETGLPVYDPSIFDLASGNVVIVENPSWSGFTSGFLNSYRDFINNFNYNARNLIKGTASQYEIDIKLYNELKEKAYGSSIDFINSQLEDSDVVLVSKGYKQITKTSTKPKTLSLFGLDYEVMNTDKKYSHSYKEEPTIYKIVDGLHNRAYELILVDEDNNIYVQLNQELFNLYSSGFRNYYTKEGSFYGKGYLTNLSRIDQNGNHVYQNLQMIDTAYGHQRVSFYSSQNDNFTYYYFNDITGKFSMYLRSETKEDYVRIEFENLYYNINNSLHEETYYTHDDIKNKKLTPYIIKNVSNSPTVTIAENILMYREVDSNIDIGDDVINFDIPVSELEQTINDGLITGVIKNENPSITITDTGVTTVDGINYDELVKAVEKAITESKATEESKDKDTKRNLDIDMPDVIIDKFPFSIPFDLYNAVTILAAEPKAPVFTIPLSNKEIGDYKIGDNWYSANGKRKNFYIDYSITVDLAEYEIISIISRSLIFIAFVVFLIMSTNKLIGR